MTAYVYTETQTIDSANRHAISRFTDPFKVRNTGSETVWVDPAGRDS